MNNNLHAHVETYSVDCDGSISRDWIEQMRDNESDIDFHNRMAAWIVNTYSILADGTLLLKRFDDGDVRMTWFEPTEEGRTEAEVTFCTDDCNLTARGYRDHRAESMGY